MLQVQPEHLTYQGNFLLVYDQLATFGVEIIAQDRDTAGPFAASSGSTHLVAGSVGDCFPFKLREAEKDIQHQTTGGVCCVYRLGDRHEAHVVAIEYFHEPGEVQQGAGEAVHFVNDHAVDVPCLDVGHQVGQCGAFDVPAAEPAVVVVGGQAGPTVSLLALDVRLASFPLSVERIEVLV